MEPHSGAAACARPTYGEPRSGRLLGASDVGNDAISARIVQAVKFLQEFSAAAARKHFVGAGLDLGMVVRHNPYGESALGEPAYPLFAREEPFDVAVQLHPGRSIALA